MIIKNGLVWEESGSFLTKDLHIDSDTHRIAMGPKYASVCRTNL